MYRLASVVAACAAVLVLGAAMAQAETGACLPIDRANHLIGIAVQDPAGNPLGRLDDIVLRPNDDTISYGVLAQGGVLGIGTKYVAVPWKAFALKFDRTALVLDVPPDVLRSASGFDRSHWPEGPDVRLLCCVGEPFPEDTTAGVGASDFRARRLSQVRNTAVQGGDGRDLGTLNDFVIDMNGGHVVYGIVLYGGFFLFGQKMAPVPYPALLIDADKHLVRVYGGREDLDALAFRDYEYPDFGNHEYAMRIYGQYHQEPYWETFGYVPPSGEPVKVEPPAPKVEPAAPKPEKQPPEIIQTPIDESPFLRFPGLEPPMMPLPDLGQETPMPVPEEDLWLNPGVPPAPDVEEYILAPMEDDPVNGPVP